MKNLFLLLFILFLFSCKTQQQNTKTVSETKTETIETSTDDSLLTYLERTACYGTCPIYKFSIYQSGYAVYEGKRFVEKEGKYESKIAKTILEEIKTKAKAINYFDLKDEYPKTASDFPAVKTAVLIDGKRKEIFDGSGAPSALKEFEKFLDSVKDSANWKPLQ